jgi:hypothetical protein
MANLSSMGSLFKPLLSHVAKMSKDRKKAEVKVKMKAAVKVKRG